MSSNRIPLICFCLLASACWTRFEPQDETASGDSEPSETAVDPDAAHFGMAKNAIIMCHDGARIEETWGDETTYGEGYSDAYDGPTDEIWPIMREQLVPQGAMCKPGYANGITITLPGNVDAILGKRTPIGHHPSDYGGGYYRPEIPTIFEHMREQHTEVEQDQVGALANTVHMQSVDYSVYPGMGADFGGDYWFLDAAGGSDVNTQPAIDPDLIEVVASQITDGARLLLINLHQIDRSGHYDPFHHAGNIQQVDEPITTLWNETIQGNPELADETLLFLFSDHGRHRFADSDASWMHHGDGCSGCREVPILLLGPGIDPGTVTLEPHAIEDLGITAAWLLGVNMPFADGMIMTDMLKGQPEVAQRSGASALHASGSVLAYQRYKDDFGNRSDVVIDGETFENPDAMHVERPKVLVDGDTTYACWREVTVGTDDEFWNWVPVCKLRDGSGSWSDLGAPMYELVWPFFDPALATDSGGRLWALWSASDTGNAEGSAGARLARWSEARGWEGGDDDTDATYFPVHPALAMTEDYAFAAWSGGASELEGRYTRHVEVYRVSWPAGGTPSWSRSFSSSTDDAPGEDATGRTFERVEDPTMLADDDTIYLAYLGLNEDGIFIMATQLDDPEGDWASVHTLDTSGKVFIHVRPSFSDEGYLHWARLSDDDTAEVCRAHINALTDPTCQDTGAAYIESVAGVPEGAWVASSSGDRQWELSLVEFE